MEKVMIVDDSKTSRRVLRTILESYEYEVVGEAANGKEAVELYREFKPEVVTMDVTMPEMDGLEALELIMKEDADAKVIMVTAAAQKNKMLDAIKLGAVDFIQKPFEAEQIVSIINKVCSES